MSQENLTIYFDEVPREPRLPDPALLLEPDTALVPPMSAPWLSALGVASGTEVGGSSEL